MGRYRVVLLVVLLAIGQLVLSYVQADLFHDQTLEWAALKERQMAESGVPPDLRAHVTGSVGYDASRVSRYVLSVTHTSILVNAALLLFVFYECRRGARSSGDEA